MYVVSSAKTLKLIIYQGDLKNKKLRHEALSKIVSLIKTQRKWKTLHQQKLKQKQFTEEKLQQWRFLTVFLWHQDKVCPCV